MFQDYYPSVFIKKEDVIYKSVSVFSETLLHFWFLYFCNHIRHILQDNKSCSPFVNTAFLFLGSTTTLTYILEDSSFNPIWLPILHMHTHIPASFSDDLPLRSKQRRHSITITSQKAVLTWLSLMSPVQPKLIRLFSRHQSNWEVWKAFRNLWYLNISRGLEKHNRDILQCLTKYFFIKQIQMKMQWRLN